MLLLSVSGKLVESQDDVNLILCSPKLNVRHWMNYIRFYHYYSLLLLSNCEICQIKKTIERLSVNIPCDVCCILSCRASVCVEIGRAHV